MCGVFNVCARLRWVVVQRSRRRLLRGGRDKRSALSVVSDVLEREDVTLTRYDFLFPHAHLVVDKTVLLHVVAVLH